MARIALISCNITRDPYPVYPLGMSMVADAARSAGHLVQEYDILRHGAEGLGSFLETSPPDYIGLSLRNADSVNYVNQESYTDPYRAIVRRIRGLSDAPVILGGSAYSIFPEELLEAVEADYGIPGEGERPFCDLIARLESGSPPPRSIFTAGPMRADEIPTCHRDKDISAWYLHHGGMLNVQTKRGCPHRCLYCSYPHLEGNNYRFRDPETVAEEFTFLAREYNADYIAVTDSVFNDAKGHYLEIAEALVKRSPVTRWMCFMRPQQFKKTEITLLKASGLSAVEWGTDASTDETLGGMQKSFTWPEVVDSNNRFAEAGIPSSHFIIFGGPGETPATVKAGLGNIETLKNAVVFAATGIRIFPHTPIYHRLIGEGNLDPEKNLLVPVYYFSPDTPPDLLDDAISASFSGRDDRIYPEGDADQRNRVQAFHDMGYRGPVWDLILGQTRTRRK